MKHYTSISQSKKLLELGLSPESADMCYIQTPADEYRPVAYNLEYCNNLKQQKGSDMNLIPCWSLGALLDVLPSVTLDSSDDHYYRLQCMGRSTEWYDSAIDACVDMIEKLHKQNLL